ncbi:UDP-N-acetylmuramate dehydrogenase [Allohahella marinimesophila]|uniref:UDP-N-acetylenolpyruvoylglucosamine reductase n=1 Tax=Allohahella marinimesophila TaxID=1054972 RepID=A0ABP7Q8K5_9GAMM
MPSQKDPDAIEGWQSEVDLECFNTLAIPAVAERFCQVVSLDQLRDSLATFSAAGYDNPLILGGGSNVVLTQARYPAVVHLQMTGIEFGERGRVQVAAGENWHAFVQTTLAHGCYGLENLALIPGSCGAAPIQNIGAYGVEVGEFIVAVSAVHRHTGKIQEFSAEACGFAYRDSYFKTTEGREWVVVRLHLQLRESARLNLDYPELARAWQAQVEWLSEAELAITDEARRLACVVAALRRHKLPDPAIKPNAGSFFKNPVVDSASFEQLQRQWPDIVAFPLANGQVKLAAGWMIDQAGHKGRVSDGVGLHDRQALVLVNPGHRNGEAVLAFASSIQADIARQFGLSLEIEPDQY